MSESKITTAPLEIGQDKIIYEYCLLRYVPDIERGEFVNVGLLMVCKRYRWLRAAIKICPDKISRLSGRIDLGLLKRQLSVFERTDVPGRDLPVEEKYRWMAAMKSAIIQTSPSHPGILLTHASSIIQIREALDTQFTTLFTRLVE